MAESSGLGYFLGFFGGTAVVGFGLGVVATVTYQKMQIPQRRANSKFDHLSDDDGGGGGGAVDGGDESEGESDSESDDDAAAAAGGGRPMTSAYAASAKWGLLDAPYKMLLCVNMDLKDEAGKSTKMKPGKVAAQCCHAVLGAYKRGARKAPAAVKWWSMTGQAKVCVKVPKEEELLELQATLAAAGIVSYLVEDAGRTQVAPGSKTVLAVGPAPVKVLDQFTKHLKLY